MAGTLVKREFMKALVLPDKTYIGKKGNAYIYRNRWTGEYYKVMLYGDGYIVETWVGGCGC